ncbi:MAG: hypothetical protein IIZ11_00785 [Erysipelotrichaceae bacterium]|nr:hypothetical protein [Erysipelotrichaceae bacterium]
MLAKDILKVLDAKCLYLADESLLEKNYDYCFATDLMSDALAMINNHNESLVFVTGLANLQAFQTAMMLDIDFIIFVRNKKNDEVLIETAKELGYNVFKCSRSMFDTCAILGQEGIKGLDIN